MDDNVTDTVGTPKETSPTNICKSVKICVLKIVLNNNQLKLYVCAVHLGEVFVQGIGADF